MGSSPAVRVASDGNVTLTNESREELEPAAMERFLTPSQLARLHRQRPGSSYLPARHDSPVRASKHPPAATSLVPVDKGIGAPPLALEHAGHALPAHAKNRPMVGPRAGSEAKAPAGRMRGEALQQECIRRRLVADYPDG